MSIKDKLEELRGKEEILESLSRRTGRTTRLVDRAIQTIFTGQKWKAYDHYKTRDADRMLFDRVANRLAFEHGLDSYSRKKFKINTRELTIQYTP